MNAPTQIILPPHSVESEQALLGGLLIAGETAWDRVADIVAEADFYRDDHRRIFSHIRRLSETGQTVDVLTVSNAIEASNEADQTGGLGYLGEIANATPSAANIASYARAVVEKSRMRALLVFSDHVQGLALRADGMTAQARIDEAEGLLMALAEGSIGKDEPAEMSALLGEVVNDIEARMLKGGAISGLSTGFTDLDEMLDGLKDGDLIILAGRPSMGKSALALNIAENVALADKPVMVFSLEMSDKQLIKRSLSSVGRINNKVLDSGRLTDEDWDRVTNALGKLHRAPLIIDQTPALTAGQMRARARRQMRRGGLSLIVIDYLQLMSGKGENRHQELSAITKALKAMAKTLCVPVICLSQLSRKVEDRSDKRPMMSDLRESGAIEEDADVIAMLYRDEYYRPDSSFHGFAEVLIRKNRMGQCGDVRMVFQPEFSRFGDADREALYQANERAKSAGKMKPKKERGFHE
jgi:replicative DNA helicase